MGRVCGKALVDEQAREWFMLQHERALTAQEQAEFNAWMLEPEHQSGYHQLEQICAGLAAIAATEEGARMRRGSRSAGLSTFMRSVRSFFTSMTPLPALASAIVLLMVVGAGIWGSALLVPDSALDQPQTFVTRVAETRTVLLEDGSEITLSADSQIQVNFSAGRRDVALLKGQAFFVVRKNAERPFFVNTSGTSVRVVGTRFDVRRGRDEIKVTVEEGIVDVAPLSSSASVAGSVAGSIADKVNPAGVRLLAGQQVRMRAGENAGDQAGDVVAVAQDSLASWRHGKLVYHHARLAEVVADANRYRKGAIVLAAPQLADLRVTTSFSVDQVETMLSMLEQSLPVTMYHEDNDRVVIWPKGAVN